MYRYTRFLATAVLTIGLTASAAAQQETLISGDVSFGGFGGPVLKLSAVNGEPGLFVGGRGGAIINFQDNHTIAIGGGGTGLATNVPAEGVLTDEGEQLYLALGYGGVELEYVNRTDELIHLSGSALIGAGGASHRRKNYEDFDQHLEKGDAFFVFEPGVNGMLNVTSFFRMGLGVSYRLVSGVSLAGINDNDLSGLTGNLTLKFGGF